MTLWVVHSSLKITSDTSFINIRGSGVDSASGLGWRHLTPKTAQGCFVIWCECPKHAHLPRKRVSSEDVYILNGQSEWRIGQINLACSFDCTTLSRSSKMLVGQALPTKAPTSERMRYIGRGTYMKFISIFCWFAQLLLRSEAILCGYCWNWWSLTQSDYQSV